MILRVEKDVIAFAERPLQLSLTLSMGVSRSWEELLMKRSNNVENCLTLSLYFGMLPMAWDF